MMMATFQDNAANSICMHALMKSSAYQFEIISLAQYKDTVTFQDCTGDY